MNLGELRVVVDANVLASRTLTDWLFYYILTSNRVHNFTMLPEQEKYQVIHPDDFLLALAHLDAKGFADARREQLTYYGPRGADIRTLAQALANAGCPKFSQLLLDYA